MIKQDGFKYKQHKTSSSIVASKDMMLTHKKIKTTKVP
jgi:hypothetical protein